MTPPIPQSSTARVDADEENLKLSQDFVDDKGQAMTVTFEAKFDHMVELTGRRADDVAKKASQQQQTSA